MDYQALQLPATKKNLYCRFYFVMYQSIIYKHIWIHTSYKFILNKKIIFQINSLKNQISWYK